MMGIFQFIWNFCEGGPYAFFVCNAIMKAAATLALLQKPVDKLFSFFQVISLKFMSPKAQKDWVIGWKDANNLSRASDF